MGRTQACRRENLGPGAARRVLAGARRKDEMVREVRGDEDAACAIERSGVGDGGRQRAVHPPLGAVLELPRRGLHIVLRPLARARRPPARHLHVEALARVEDAEVARRRPAALGREMRLGDGLASRGERGGGDGGGAGRWRRGGGQRHSVRPPAPAASAAAATTSTSPSDATGAERPVPSVATTSALARGRTLDPARLKPALQPERGGSSGGGGDAASGSTRLVGSGSGGHAAREAEAQQQERADGGGRPSSGWQHRGAAASRTSRADPLGLCPPVCPTCIPSA